MRVNKAINVLILSICGIASAPSYASVAHFVLNGTVGDYISGGQTIDNVYSSLDPLLIWNWASFNNVGTVASPAASGLSFTFLLDPWAAADDQYASLSFSSPQGSGMPINTGVTYSNAERDPFASIGSPGLEINYGHRGCNTLTGDFTVDTLTFANNAIDKFSVMFNQSCDGGALMSGSFTYDANATSLSSDVPEPAIITLFGVGMLGFAFVRRSKPELKL